MKGIHHIPLGLVITFFAGPLVNLAFWLGKELGEATERAGGTKEAFSKKTGKNYYGKAVPVWEPMDFIYPTAAGYALDAIIRTF